MSDNKTTIVQKLFKLVGRGKWDEVADLLHPDFEILPAPSHPYAGIYRGIEGYQNLLRKVFTETYERFEPKILEFAEGPNSVVTLCTVTAQGKKTGRTVEMSLAEVFRFEEGKLRSICPHYFDTKTLVDL